MKFEWDITKERVNIRKRGITFEQASYVFSDPFALSKYDDEHSDPEEDRWILLGNAMNEPKFHSVLSAAINENIVLVSGVTA
uniref:Ribonuclease toxin, BrnT, of type II toxin-antitoxin system n=1 Tax=Candidatus Kentrum sp. LPFa TaxID=2126335 RepID=A0A450WTS7_9GAMM|nr:MAG: Ribonuclease toxin, BrnT, of type II toxin-antitoxin system [Candidatus Kentron sp. LPFa]